MHESGHVVLAIVKPTNVYRGAALVTAAEPPITGFSAEGWEEVRTAFTENFALRGELGANLCIIHNGHVVVDIAGGWVDSAKSRAFDTDTLALVFSTTKAMTAIAAHYLIDRGQLDLDAPVAKYWPEFATNGKGEATVAMMLNHSVGVAGFHEPLKPEAYLDWDYMVARLAAEEPFWEPGSRSGYHALNFGWTVGELVRRVAGQPLGAFFREYIADPLDADFWIGLPEEFEARVAKNVPTIPRPGDPITDFHANMVSNPTSISALTFANTGGFVPTLVDEASGEFLMNTRPIHAASLGGATGVGSAKGIAKVFGALADGRLISRDHVAKMSQSSMISMHDPILLIPTHFASGFMKSTDNRKRRMGHIESFVIGEKAFGHVGFGGSFGVYDREADVAIGYVMNRMHEGVLLDSRGQSLIDATYQVLGYRTNAPGVWVR